MLLSCQNCKHYQSSKASCVKSLDMPQDMKIEKLSESINFCENFSKRKSNDSEQGGTVPP